MIHVDRNRVPRPAVLSQESDSPAQRELADAKKFFSSAGKKRRGQKRFAFKVYKSLEVLNALGELFYGKCAYCERRYQATQPVDVEHFRPKSGVLERPDHPGYWWLAATWENLLPSCIDCSRIRIHEGIRIGKANRFPLEEESERAFEPGQEKEEHPLLLDPCVDMPEEHLVFEESGMVVSDTARGQATITVLGLNRLGLVQERRAAARLVLSQIERVMDLAALGAEDKRLLREVKVLRRMTAPEEEFAGLKRQLIRAGMEKLGGIQIEDSWAISTLPTPRITKARKRRAKAAFSAFENDQSSYSLDNEQGREKYRGQRRLIERVVIEDVKAIQTLDLNLTSTSGRTPWLMLLGENGTGKSTALQATALALLGARSFVRLAETRGVRPADFVRFRCKRGSVSVKLSGFPKPHTLVFRANRVDFTSPTGDKTSIVFDAEHPRVEGTGWEPQTLLLGYGATKLLPRGTSQQPDSAADGDFSRVDNLFDPFVPLLNAEKWLLGLDQTRFDDTAMILKDLMALAPSAELTREEGHVVVAYHGARVPLRQLSDGYQGVVAMTVDILEVALRLWPNLQEAEGIVLLDEVGAHLHPTWKMRIVGSLRKALPAMQFLATTHDPLCLRGLGAGEVAVMRRDEDSRVISLTELPSPADFRIDQLLTSDFFGLNSTIDPDVEAVFDEYYALLALPELTEPQAQRLKELREQLKDRRHLGTTLRENLMYDAIDRLVAQHRREPSIPLAVLKQSAVDEVAKIWSEPI